MQARNCGVCQAAYIEWKSAVAERDRARKIATDSAQRLATLLLAVSTARTKLGTSRTCIVCHGTSYKHATTCWIPAFMEATTQ